MIEYLQLFFTEHWQLPVLILSSIGYAWLCAHVLVEEQRHIAEERAHAERMRLAAEAHRRYIERHRIDRWQD